MNITATLVYGFVVPGDRATEVYAREADVRALGCKLVYHGDAMTGPVAVTIAAGDEWSCDLTDPEPRAFDPERMNRSLDNTAVQLRLLQVAEALTLETKRFHWLMTVNAT